MITDRYFEDYVVGEVTRSERFSISEEMVATYLKLVGDDHAVHSYKEFCRRRFGSPDLVVPGCLILALADSYWANLVTPSDPFSPHYGQDKVRYLGRLTCGEEVSCEFTLKESMRKDALYGMLVYETYVKKTDGTPVLYEIDKVLVPFREKQPAVL